jgi:hypothetical protein
MRNKYDQKTIKKACSLYSKKISLRDIMKETGIRSTSTIQFHCNPDYQEAHVKRSLEWRKKHPRRWKAINKKAVKKYQKKVFI